MQWGSETHGSRLLVIPMEVVAEEALVLGRRSSGEWCKGPAGSLWRLMMLVRGDLDAIREGRGAGVELGVEVSASGRIAFEGSFVAGISGQTDGIVTIGDMDIMRHGLHKPWNAFSCLFSVPAMPKGDVRKVTCPETLPVTLVRTYKAEDGKLKVYGVVRITRVRRKPLTVSQMASKPFIPPSILDYGRGFCIPRTIPDSKKLTSDAYEVVFEMEKHKTAPIPPEEGWPVKVAPASIEISTEEGWEEVGMKRTRIPQAGLIPPRPSDVTVPSQPLCRRQTGLLGLQNQGATCYLNSILQSLFHLRLFRKIVFETPTTTSPSTSPSTSTTTPSPPSSSSASASASSTSTSALNPATTSPPPSSSPPASRFRVVVALQELFFGMQCGGEVATTDALTRSFGWDAADSFTQNDVHEMLRVLMEHLEVRQRKTALAQSMPQLFRGRTVIEMRCLHVEERSVRTDDFYDIQLPVRGHSSLLSSLRAHCAAERLEGENKWHTDGHGPQDAERRTRIATAPPVLFLQLNRFAYDTATYQPVKINTPLSFPETLDLSPFIAPPEVLEEVKKREEEEREEGEEGGEEDVVEVVEVGDRSSMEVTAEGCKKAAEEAGTVYRLHSVLVHDGGAGYGHYYAYIRPMLGMAIERERELKARGLWTREGEDEGEEEECGEEGGGGEEKGVEKGGGEVGVERSSGGGVKLDDVQRSLDLSGSQGWIARSIKSVLNDAKKHAPGREGEVFHEVCLRHAEEKGLPLGEWERENALPDPIVLCAGGCGPSGMEEDRKGLLGDSYITPEDETASLNPWDAWYQVNDSIVKPASPQEAIEENFGSNTSASHGRSAYMLVYIAENAASHVMFPDTMLPEEKEKKKRGEEEEEEEEMGGGRADGKEEDRKIVESEFLSVGGVVDGDGDGYVLDEEDRYNSLKRIVNQDDAALGVSTTSSTAAAAALSSMRQQGAPPPPSSSTFPPPPPSLHRGEIKHSDDSDVLLDDSVPFPLATKKKLQFNPSSSAATTDIIEVPDDDDEQDADLSEAIQRSLTDTNSSFLPPPPSSSSSSASPTLSSSSSSSSSAIVIHPTESITTTTTTTTPSSSLAIVQTATLVHLVDPVQQRPFCVIPRVPRVPVDMSIGAATIATLVRAATKKKREAMIAEEKRRKIGVLLVVPDDLKRCPLPQSSKPSLMLHSRYPASPAYSPTLPPDWFVGWWPDISGRDPESDENRVVAANREAPMWALYAPVARAFQRPVHTFRLWTMQPHKWKATKTTDAGKLRQAIPYPPSARALAIAGGPVPGSTEKPHPCWDAMGPVDFDLTTSCTSSTSYTRHSSDVIGLGGKELGEALVGVADDVLIDGMVAKMHSIDNLLLKKPIGALPDLVLFVEFFDASIPRAYVSIPPHDEEWVTLGPFPAERKEDVPSSSIFPASSGETLDSVMKKCDHLAAAQTMYVAPRSIPKVGDENPSFCLPLTKSSVVAVPFPPLPAHATGELNLVEYYGDEVGEEWLRVETDAWKHHEPPDGICIDPYGSLEVLSMIRRGEPYEFPKRSFLSLIRVPTWMDQSQVRTFFNVVTYFSQTSLSTSSSSSSSSSSASATPHPVVLSIDDVPPVVTDIVEPYALAKWPPTLRSHAGVVSNGALKTAKRSVTWDQFANAVRVLELEQLEVAQEYVENVRSLPQGRPGDPVMSFLGILSEYVNAERLRVREIHRHPNILVAAAAHVVSEQKSDTSPPALCTTPTSTLLDRRGFDDMIASSASQKRAVPSKLIKSGGVDTSPPPSIPSPRDNSDDALPSPLPTTTTTTTTQPSSTSMGDVLYHVALGYPNVASGCVFGMICAGRKKIGNADLNGRLFEIGVGWEVESEEDEEEGVIDVGEGGGGEGEVKEDGEQWWTELEETYAKVGFAKWYSQCQSRIDVCIKLDANDVHVKRAIAGLIADKDAAAQCLVRSCRLRIVAARAGRWGWPMSDAESEIIETVAGISLDADTLIRRLESIAHSLPHHSTSFTILPLLSLVFGDSSDTIPATGSSSPDVVLVDDDEEEEDVVDGSGKREGKEGDGLSARIRAIQAPFIAVHPALSVRESYEAYAAAWGFDSDWSSRFLVSSRTEKLFESGGVAVGRFRDVESVKKPLCMNLYTSSSIANISPTCTRACELAARLLPDDRVTLRSTIPLSIRWGGFDPLSLSTNLANTDWEPSDAFLSAASHMLVGDSTDFATSQPSPPRTRRRHRRRASTKAKASSASDEKSPIAISDDDDDDDDDVDGVDEVDSGGGGEGGEDEDWVGEDGKGGDEFKVEDWAPWSESEKKRGTDGEMGVVWGKWVDMEQVRLDETLWDLSEKLRHALHLPKFVGIRWSIYQEPNMSYVPKIIQPTQREALEQQGITHILAPHTRVASIVRFFLLSGDTSVAGNTPTTPAPMLGLNSTEVVTIGTRSNCHPLLEKEHWSDGNSNPAFYEWCGFDMPPAGDASHKVSPVDINKLDATELHSNSVRRKLCSSSRVLIATPIPLHEPTFPLPNEAPLDPMRAALPYLIQAAEHGVPSLHSRWLPLSAAVALTLRITRTMWESNSDNDTDGKVKADKKESASSSSSSSSLGEKDSSSLEGRELVIWSAVGRVRPEKDGWGLMSPGGKLVDSLWREKGRIDVKGSRELIPPPFPIGSSLYLTGKQQRVAIMRKRTYRGLMGRVGLIGIPVGGSMRDVACAAAFVSVRVPPSRIGAYFARHSPLTVNGNGNVVDLKFSKHTQSYSLLYDLPPVCWSQIPATALLPQIAKEFKLCNEPLNPLILPSQEDGDDVEVVADHTGAAASAAASATTESKEATASADWNGDGGDEVRGGGGGGEDGDGDFDASASAATTKTTPSSPTSSASSSSSSSSSLKRRARKFTGPRASATSLAVDIEDDDDSMGDVGSTTSGRGGRGLVSSAVRQATRRGVNGTQKTVRRSTGRVSGNRMGGRRGKHLVACARDNTSGRMPMSSPVVPGFAAPRAQESVSRSLLSGGKLTVKQKPQEDAIDSGGSLAALSSVTEPIPFRLSLRTTLSGIERTVSFPSIVFEPFPDRPYISDVSAIAPADALPWDPSQYATSPQASKRPRESASLTPADIPNPFHPSLMYTPLPPWQLFRCPPSMIQMMLRLGKADVIGAPNTAPKLDLHSSTPLSPSPPRKSTKKQASVTSFFTSPTSTLPQIPVAKRRKRGGAIKITTEEE